MSSALGMHNIIHNIVTDHMKTRRHKSTGVSESTSNVGSCSRKIVANNDEWMCLVKVGAFEFHSVKHNSSFRLSAHLN